MIQIGVGSIPPRSQSRRGKPSPVPSLGGPVPTSGAEYVGHCVKCRKAIHTDQEWGRAEAPLIGKAHTGRDDCWGEA
jgi:hypothetical protein